MQHAHHHHGRGHNFKALANALESGDLAGAQQAFQDLTSHTPQKASTTQNDNPFANDFKALGDALQSGDLSGAQKAFETLKNDWAARRGQHQPAPPTQVPIDNVDIEGGTSTLNISA